LVLNNVAEFTPEVQTKVAAQLAAQLQVPASQVTLAAPVNITVGAALQLAAFPPGREADVQAGIVEYLGAGNAATNVTQTAAAAATNRRRLRAEKAQATNFDVTVTTPDATLASQVEGRLKDTQGLARFLTAYLRRNNQDSETVTAKLATADGVQAPRALVDTTVGLTAADLAEGKAANVPKVATATNLEDVVRTAGMPTNTLVSVGQTVSPAVNWKHLSHRPGLRWPVGKDVAGLESRHCHAACSCPWPTLHAAELLYAQQPLAQPGGKPLPSRRGLCVGHQPAAQRRIWWRQQRPSLGMGRGGRLRRRGHRCSRLHWFCAHQAQAAGPRRCAPAPPRQAAPA
jgi:hypothetical protein